MSQQEKAKISDRVSIFREKTGMSQKRLAEELGVTGNYVYLVEAGKRNPSNQFIISFENLEKSPVYNHPAFREGNDPVIAQKSNTLVSQLDDDTLRRSVQSLAKRLVTDPEQDRKHILGNLREVLDELENRELKPKPADALARGLVEGALENVKTEKPGQ